MPRLPSRGPARRRRRATRRRSGRRGRAPRSAPARRAAAAPGVARAHHLDGAIAHGLGEAGVERHELAVELHGVAVERGEERRVRQLEVGLVERDLRGVDRLREREAALHHVLPRRGAERLVLPERGIGERHRPGDEAAVDVTLEPAIEGREAELPSVGPLGPEVEAGEPQPVGDDVLAAMPGLEDAQGPRLEVAALVLRHREVVVLDLAQAGAAEPGGADVGAGDLSIVGQ